MGPRWLPRAVWAVSPRAAERPCVRVDGRAARAQGCPLRAAPSRGLAFPQPRPHPGPRKAQPCSAVTGVKGDAVRCPCQLPPTQDNPKNCRATLCPPSGGGHRGRGQAGRLGQLRSREPPPHPRTMSGSCSVPRLREDLPASGHGTSLRLSAWRAGVRAQRGPGGQAHGGGRGTGAGPPPRDLLSLREAPRDVLVGHEVPPTSTLYSRSGWV